MDAAYIAYRELKIKENKARRLKIVKRQRMILALIVFTIVFFMAFICRTLLSNAQEDGEISYKYYTKVEVCAGDTLEAIADRYLTPGDDEKEHYINEVINTNHLSEDGRITAGTDIIVPYYSKEFK